MLGKGGGVGVGGGLSPFVFNGHGKEEGGLRAGGRGEGEGGGVRHDVTCDVDSG